MKKIFTFLVLALVSSFANGQSFADSSSKWAYASVTFSPIDIITITFDKDTLLNGLGWNKFIRKGIGRYGKVLTESDFYLRNENGLVKYYNYKGEIDILIDFNAEIGKKWTVQGLNVEVIDTFRTQIYNQNLFTQAVEYSVDDFVVQDTIIEHIGPIKDFILPWGRLGRAVDGGEGGPILCFKNERLEVSYNSPFSLNYDCDKVFDVSNHFQDFGAIGSTWYFSSHAGGLCGEDCEYTKLSSVLDTFIGGEKVHKILQTVYSHTGDTISAEPIYVYTQWDTVFTWSRLQSKFLKTFIFNGEIGDTLVIDKPDHQNFPESEIKFIVDSVYDVNISGTVLKKYETTSTNGFRFNFMDRIGGLAWFFPRGIIIPETDGPIRCFSDNDIAIKFQSIECDYVAYTAVDDIENDNNIKISPNPTNGFIEIENKYLEPIDQVLVFDIYGKLIFSKKSENVDLTGLPNGSYVLVIKLKSGQRIHKKVIKK